jgi:hypothetical protein
MTTFNNHLLIKKLINDGGYTEKQAEIFTEGMIEIADYSSAQLVTQKDIIPIKTSIEKIEVNLNWIKTLLCIVLGMIVTLWFK